MSQPPPFYNYLCLLLQCRCSRVVCCADDSATLQNVALNRPAFQSSKYSFSNWRDKNLARLVNDGDFETTLNVNGEPKCTHSDREDNPWWAVDLGVPRVVYRVDLTNRGDGWGMKKFESVSNLSLILKYRGALLSQMICPTTSRPLYICIYC